MVQSTSALYSHDSPSRFAIFSSTLERDVPMWYWLGSREVVGKTSPSSSSSLIFSKKLSGSPISILGRSLLSSPAFPRIHGVGDLKSLQSILRSTEWPRDLISLKAV